ncbi:NPCBM/NEW2 domain-containing protein [Actinophytocola sp.]|uniref:NPCBM/NEW2 domain-containing protein n=1 Tax=Actinophytocola sp. TaxID=1872138 RepID=UPI002ED1B5BD
MRRFVCLLLVVVVLPFFVPTAQATPGLAALPPMGFNNWNAFGCDVDETLIKETADVLVSSGLADRGYEYVNIDDCWSLRERGPDGRLVPDPAKFPGGISGVADYVHAKGLKLGIYGDAGTKTCAGFPGSLGHETVDAQTWADWGVDYLKYDNCNNQSDGSQADYIRRYTAMRDALNKTGRPIVYAICEWGTSQPWLWGNGVGQLWRTTGDINDEWPSLKSIIAKNAPLAPYAGPGHWNDPDMMEIGNGGMTATEYRTHMSMWAMMAAPLLIGTDLRTASPETLAILGNREIIAVDQDRLGVAGAVVSDRDGLMVLDKPLANGDRAIALYNSTDSLATVSVPASGTGLSRAPAYRLRELWTGDVRQAKSTISAAVPAHGTVVYRVRPLRDPAGTAPSVTADAGLGTLVPDAGGTLTTTVTNRGAGTITDVAVSARVPDGWTVTAQTPARQRRLATDTSLTTTWTVTAPEGTPAGRYPVTITADYTWGRHRPGETASELVSTVVNAPPDGRRHLSTVEPVTGTAGTDTSAGGSLITIGGRVYQRGLGTTAPSELVYYLGDRCTQLVTDAGVDDESTGQASFTVHADDAVAASAEVASGEPPVTLTADLTGVDWLRLVTAGTAHADWAAPVLTCGDSTPNDPVEPEEETLFSFESGTEDFTIANPGDGGTVAQSTAFATEGTHGLEVTTPLGGNWYGARLSVPFDLTGATRLKVDVKADAAAGTTGEIAVQTGAGWSWCQGSRWAWTDAGKSRTVSVTFEELDCPAGVTPDPSQIHAVWVFLNGGHVYVDDIRAE